MDDTPQRALSYQGFEREREIKKSYREGGGREGEGETGRQMVSHQSVSKKDLKSDRKRFGRRETICH